MRTNPLPLTAWVRVPRWLSILSHCTRPCHLRDMPSHHQAVAKWLPVLALPLTALALGRFLTPWIYMWAIAFTLFLAAKWLTVFPLLVATTPVRMSRFIAYLALWPGLDATAFCHSKAKTVPKKGDCLCAVIKISFGAALFRIACNAAALHPILAGCVGMVGLVFTLHFGLFHLLSIGWRACGVDAPPIMRNPMMAASLSDFWNRRWNLAFSDLTRRHLIPPLARHLPPPAALLAAFLISGLLHELVISVPAGGGYGLPTAYFLVQGGGLLLERSKFGALAGLRDGWRGRAFFLMVAGIPVMALFPPVFVERIILPLLHAL